MSSRTAPVVGKTSRRVLAVAAAVLVVVLLVTAGGDPRAVPVTQ